MQCQVQREIKHETIYGDIRRQRDAMINLILQVIELKRRKGLTMEQRKNLKFEDVEGLIEAGWTEDLYQKEKLADERSFEE